MGGWVWMGMNGQVGDATLSSYHALPPPTPPQARGAAGRTSLYLPYLPISPYISLYLRLEALQAALKRRRSAALGAHSETPSYSASPLPSAGARA